MCSIPVIPRSTILLGSKAILQSLSRHDRTLTDARTAVVPRRACLLEAMPVQRRAFVKMLGNVNVDPITPVGFDQRSGEQIIYQNGKVV